VDDVGKILEIRPEQNAVLVKVNIPAELMAYMTVKGSIALDGVSLTIQEMSGTGVWVSLIPHTFRETRFKRLRPGDFLNIEADPMAKHALKNRMIPLNGGISLEFLKIHGYC
jgi:riboflavin synthase